MTTYTWFAYGIKLISEIELPLKLPKAGLAEHKLKLKYTDIAKLKKNTLYYKTPLTRIHDNMVQLFSSLPINIKEYNINREWKLNVGDDISFQWTGVEDEIQITFFEDIDLNKLSFWLLHTVLPVYLILQQKSYILHASSIEYNDGAIVFLAPSYGGKSTLVDFFVKKGHKMLSDDKLSTYFDKERFYASPSYPYRRPYRKYEDLGIHSELFTKKPLPIQTFYLLQSIDINQKVSIENIGGLKKFEILKTSYLYEPTSITKRSVKYLMQLGKDIPMYQVNVPRDLKKLQDVYKSILKNEENLGCNQ